MTWAIGTLLIILFIWMFLFTFEWIPSDVAALSLLLTLVFCGLIPADKAFAGFGSDTVMLILGLLLMTAALMRTGVMDLVGGWILRFTGKSTSSVLLVIMIASALLGAFMSNTASTAFFIPVVLGIAAKASISPTKLLLPLAFSSILSSSVTLISTSTNIVVDGAMRQYGVRPGMGMFELAPVGIPIAIVGILYVFFIARHWLPDRSQGVDLNNLFGLRPYLTELLVLPESRLAGKSLEESGLGKDLDVTVVRIVRDKNLHIAPKRDMVLQAGDVVLVEGKSDEIIKIKDTTGLEIKADFKLADPSLATEELGLIEAVILPKSPLLGRTLKNIHFRERYGLQVLGINRRGHILRSKISQLPLHVGDMLLIQGAKQNLAALADDHTFQIIGQVGENRPKRKKAPLAVTIFLIALALGTFKIFPMPVAILSGVVALFVTRCMTPEEAYHEVEWKAIMLIGSMLALGTAMEETGAAKYLASQIVGWIGQWGPLWILAGFFFLTIALTQPMSNQAAAIVVLPIAIQTATQLDLNPRTFVMMIAVAASCSYLTPLEPSCLMVYGPGNYRFSDFVKVGSVLTVLIFAIAMLMVPRVWPL